MANCVDCQHSWLTVERRQGDDMLCKSSDDKVTEHKPLILRSTLSKSDTFDSERVPRVHTAGILTLVNKVASQHATATKQSLTPPETFVEPFNNLHCHEHCKFVQSDQGDMIRCCLRFRWFHDGCVHNIDEDTPGSLLVGSQFVIHDGPNARTHGSNNDNETNAYDIRQRSEISECVFGKSNWYSVSKIVRFCAS